MLHLAVVCSSLLAVSPPSSQPLSPSDLHQYEAAKAHAGRDPDAHVKLALWCERHGMNAERLKHLAIAVLSDPNNAAARGLMGLVSYGGRWQRADAVAEIVKADDELTATLADYNSRRAKIEESVAAQKTQLDQARQRNDGELAYRLKQKINATLAGKHEELAFWCKRAGLASEARAHLSEATRLEPSRETAWKELGCRNYNGQWMNEEQIAADLASTKAQHEANRHWEPLLARWKTWLRERTRSNSALVNLAGITDPRAVPSVWRIFARGTQGDQLVAEQVLAHIDAPSASAALTRLALFSESPEVRHGATQSLESRDPRDVISTLIAFFEPEMSFRVESPKESFRTELNRLEAEHPGTGSGRQKRVIRNRHSASQGTLVFETPDAVYRRTFLGGRRTGDIWIPFSGARFREDTQAEDQIARERLSMAITRLNSRNDEARVVNEAVATILVAVTGEQLGSDPRAWKAWWADQRGYAYVERTAEDKPTYSRTDQSPRVIVAVPTHTACFAKGTLVRARGGLRSIETLQVGDQILSQNVVSGALGFEPVTTVFHNPPSATLQIAFAGDAIVSTGIHRFWKVGKGWVMARELKAGDAIRTVGGIQKVVSVSAERVQPVYNLTVARNQSFFVGETGALVHDNSLVESVAEPFDAGPSLAAVVIHEK